MKKNLLITGGAGFVGSAVAADLAPLFREVIALDPRYTEEIQSGSVTKTNNPEALRRADLMIVLTAEGDTMKKYVPYLRPGTLVADDTHPPMHRPVRALFANHGIKLWKATMAEPLAPSASWNFAPLSTRATVS